VNGDIARLLPARDYKRIKAVSRDLVNAAGGAQRICTITRASPARLSEALAPQCIDRFLAVDQIADLEADCGEPIVTRELADMAGFDLIARSSSHPKATELENFSSATKEFADFASAFARAARDGHFDSDEKIRIRNEVRELIQCLHDIDMQFGAGAVSIRAVGE
jgi:hypothetical protein